MTVEFKNVRLKRLKSSDGKSAASDAKKIVLLAGRPSHAPGDHEHYAGCTLLARCLNHVPGITAEVYRDGWPKDPSVLEGADAIVFYADGGDGHPAIQGDRLAKLDELMNRGVGLACIHYGVDVPKERGGAEFLRWIGGYFETHWSVNPHWTANFASLPEHAITRGVKPFEINDEWYYHMRFQPELEGVTPLLTAVPPASTLDRPNGPHSGNPYVRAKIGQPQHVAWAYERPSGGRGFGFTGAHYHRNWGDPNFRTLVLNALVWTAGGEVPPDGVQCAVTGEDLRRNLDPK
jgi:type 1 glutamine amidotransferase